MGHTYWEKRKELVRFIRSSETGLDAYDVAKISKELCSCRTCRYFVQHYSKDGNPVDFGHCTHSNIPRAKKPGQINCGKWDLDEDAKDPVEETKGVSEDAYVQA